MRTVVPALGPRIWRTLAVGVLVGATILASAPAAQADQSASGVAEVVVIRATSDSGSEPAAQGASAADDVAALSACAVTIYGYTGYRICEFDWFWVRHSNGSYEYFVIGTNYAVFHIWPGSGGWKSLGGRARKATPNGAYYVTDTGYYGVRTIGLDNWSWCRFNVYGDWTSWSTC